MQVPFDDVEAPDYLTGKQREEFDKYAGMLKEIGIFKALDVDRLASYVISQGLYLQYTSQLTKAIKRGDTEAAGKIQIQQDKAFKQARACASDLGLSITSRCKIVVPQVDDEADYEL